MILEMSAAQGSEWGNACNNYNYNQSQELFYVDAVECKLPTLFLSQTGSDHGPTYVCTKYISFGIDLAVLATVFGYYR